MSTLQIAIFRTKRGDSPRDDRGPDMGLISNPIRAGFTFPFGLSIPSTEAGGDALKQGPDLIVICVLTMHCQRYWPSPFESTLAAAPTMSGSALRAMRGSLPRYGKVSRK